MKKNKPLLFLLIIPGTAILDLILFVVAVLIDDAIVENTAVTGQGHPAPMFALIVMLLMIAIAIAGVVVSLVLTIRGLRKNRIEKKKAEGPDNAVRPVTVEPRKRVYSQKQVNSILSRGYAVRPLLFLIILAVQIILDILMICGGFALDRVSYSPGEQLGFMMPVATIMGMFFAFVFTVAAIPVSLVLTFVNMSRRRRQMREITELESDTYPG